MLNNCLIFNESGLYNEAAKDLGGKIVPWVKELKKKEKKLAKKRRIVE